MIYYTVIINNSYNIVLNCKYMNGTPISFEFGKMTNEQIHKRLNWTPGEIKIARKLLQSEKYKYSKYGVKEINLIWGQLELLDGDKRLDFIVFSRNYLFILEVKDHTQLNDHLIPWNRQNSMKSPYRQCAEYVSVVQDQIDGNLQVIGIVLFPNLSLSADRREDYNDSAFSIFGVSSYFSEDINRDSIDTLLERTINKYGKNTERTNMFCAMIKLLPEMFVKQELDCDSELPLYMLDRKQIRFANNITLTGDRIIYGVAGSGKTIMLINKAKQLIKLYPEASILVVCFNRALRRYFEIELGNTRIQIKTIHSWHRQIVNSIGERELINLTNRDKLTDNIFEDRSILIDTAIDNKLSLPNYDFILIDEAQDFDKHWLRQLKLCLKETVSSLFLVFLDSLQAIHKRTDNRFTWKEIFISAKGRTSYLRQNYRNPKSIGEFALGKVKIAEDNPEDDNALKIIKVEQFIRKGGAVHQSKILRKEVNYHIGGIITKIPANKSIMIIHDKLVAPAKIMNVQTTIEKYAQNRKLHDCVSIKQEIIPTTIDIPIYSVFRSKGLEADVIIYLHSGKEDERVGYVAVTRSIDELYDIHVM